MTKRRGGVGGGGEEEENFPGIYLRRNIQTTNRK
jgi:hypothetical protein